MATNRDKTATAASTSEMIKVICVGALNLMLNLHLRVGFRSIISVAVLQLFHDESVISALLGNRVVMRFILR